MNTSRTVDPGAVWTVPNVLTMARIGLIGVFLWLLATGQDGWAIAALAAAGVSDFLDGFLARRWGQTTELGRILDPAADRLLTLAVLVGLALRDMLPWWLVAALLARDALVGAYLWWGQRAGAEPPRVTLLGKGATAALYVFLPLRYLAFDRWETVATVALVGVMVAGVAYWGSGIGYARDVARSVQARRGLPEPAERD